MELNPHCIKDILLVLEKRLEPNRFGRISPVQPESLIGSPPLDNYPDNVVMYHFQQMFDSNLLVRGKTYIHTGIPLISDISPTGHQLLNQIKNETTFKKFIDCLAKTCSILSALSSLKS